MAQSRLWYFGHSAPPLEIQRLLHASRRTWATRLGNFTVCVPTCEVCLHPLWTDCEETLFTPPPKKITDTLPGRYVRYDSTGA